MQFTHRTSTPSFLRQILKRATSLLPTCLRLRLADFAWAEGLIQACWIIRSVTCSVSVRACFFRTFESPEFNALDAGPEDVVVRMHRAFLGRFPSDGETAWWGGELAAGRETAASLIETFADTPEFTARLAQYFGAGAV